MNIKKVFLSLFVCFFISLTFSFAQNDSLSFFNGNWTENKVTNGVTVKQCHFDKGEFFGSNQYISLLEITKERRIDIIADSVLKKTSEMAKEVGALAAVNGSFFKMNIPYNSVDYLRVDGVMLADNQKSNIGEREMHQLGAIATFKGELFILKADSIWRWEHDIQAEDVLTSGPLLLCGGKKELLTEAPFYKNRHPRTCVGKRRDGTIVFMVVDGRNSAAAGMSISELQQVMSWLGCEDALNLDGGGSSTMVVKDLIINHPTDNKKFDAEGERRVANCVVVR